MSISEKEVKVNEPARLAAGLNVADRTITGQGAHLGQISFDFVCACIALPVALIRPVAPLRRAGERPRTAGDEHAVSTPSSGWP